MTLLPLTDPAFLADPYPWLAARRLESPAFFDPLQNEIFFTRHAEISALLRDRRLGRSRPAQAQTEPAPPGPAWDLIRRYEENHFFDKEPPAHTRLRGLVSKAFTPARVQALRPRIHSLASELLASARQHGGMEFVSAFAEPLPVAVIAELLGVPPSERGLLRPWSAAIVQMYELGHDPQALERAARAVAEFSAYLRELLASRRASAADDLLSALAAAREGAERLSPDELVATAILLLNAGHEATVNALSLGLHALLSRPGEHHRHLPAQDWVLGVEELLRYDTPAPLFHRWVYDELEISGVRLSAGARLGLLLGSANRDPARFPEPDRLDLARRDNPHLTFGLGTHYCLGAPLARLELQVAFASLFAALPYLRLAGPPLFKPGFVMRGLQRLDVIWG